MTSGESGPLQANLSCLQVNPTTAQLLQDHQPTGCRLEVVSASEAQLFYRDQPIYGGEQPLQIVAQQAGQLLANQDPALVVFYGLGLGFHLEQIRQHTDVPIVVYEPSMDVAAFVLSRVSVDLDDVYLVTDRGSYTDVLGTLLQRPGSIVAGAIPAYVELLGDDMPAFRDGLTERLRALAINRVTREQFAEEWVSNLALNLPFLGSGKSLDVFKKMFAGKPAILVGGGPSLDVNIKDLATAQGRALIIAVHTAVQPLVKNGIIPDLVVIIEGQKLDYYFNDVSQLPEMVLLASPQTHPIHLTLDFKACLSLNIAESAAEGWLEQAYGDAPLPLGGSVACTAFSVMHELGCDPIALVGMDTAYRDGRGHAVNTQTDCCEFRFDTDNSTVTTHCRQGVHQPLVFRLEMVTAWGGQGQVATRPTLSSFRHWFEAAARNWAGDRVLVNATEGGARIRGFEEATLAGFITKHCGLSLPAAEMIDAALRASHQREPAPLVAAVEAELAVIRAAAKVARLADDLATEALRKLRARQLTTVQPLLDQLGNQEDELRKLTLTTLLLNTLVGYKAEELAAELTAEKATGDEVDRTIHSVAQSRRLSQAVIDGARLLLDRFEPVAQVMTDDSESAD